jgi:hypothetical protein
MKLELLLNDCNGQGSLISESVMETQANFKPCKDNHMTTQHSRVTKTPRMATIHDVIKETNWAHLTIMHVFHAIPRWVSVGGPCTILVYITTGMVG